MAILTPILAKWFFAPLFRRYIEYHFARFDHISNIVLMTLVLCAFISIAAFTGTSVLFGAFLAGAFLTYIPSKHASAPFIVMSREEGEREADKSPTFVHTFEAYLLGVQEYLMAPLFFASVGFAIPFIQLWTGKRIWRGVLYTLLMAFAKFVVGIWIPLWGGIADRIAKKKTPPSQDHHAQRSKETNEEAETGLPSSDPDQPDQLDQHDHQGQEQGQEQHQQHTIWLSALLLGSAMVARGEIGLLIIEIGYNSTPYVSEEGFITGVWAILLNTIIGPATVGVLVKFYGKRIGEGKWGLQEQVMPGRE